jgi:hypothetical protein
MLKIIKLNNIKYKIEFDSLMSLFAAGILKKEVNFVFLMKPAII